MQQRWFRIGDFGIVEDHSNVAALAKDILAARKRNLIRGVRRGLWRYGGGGLSFSSPATTETTDAAEGTSSCAASRVFVVLSG